MTRQCRRWTSAPTLVQNRFKGWAIPVVAEGAAIEPKPGGGRDGANASRREGSAEAPHRRSSAHRQRADGWRHDPGERAEERDVAPGTLPALSGLQRSLQGPA